MDELTNSVSAEKELRTFGMSLAEFQIESSGADGFPLGQ